MTVRGTARVAWIDTSHLTRECITQAVASIQKRFTMAPFGSVYDFLAASNRHIDLVVYHAHETRAVINADIVALRETRASTPLAVLSDAGTLAPAAIKRLMVTQGVAGFILTRETGVQMLVSALGLVLDGGTFVPKGCILPPAVPEQLVAKQWPLAKEPLQQPVWLTTRELEVLTLLKEGKRNRAIAQELNVSESRVTHQSVI